MIDQLASGAAVALLNRLLARETWAREKLAPYAGRIARIEALPFVLSLAVAEDGTLTAAQGEASVTVTVDGAALPQALVEPQAVLRNVRLAGDAEFAQALSQVLQNLRPEPEEELARFVGDAAAVRIAGFLRAALARAQDNAARLARTAADYFVAENPMLVARSEAEKFSREVARLRDDVERLAKRIELLERG
ncbi:MAG: SCP2 sterol-binding domain-containing protein [Pseudomonadota bacterium]